MLSFPYNQDTGQLNDIVKADFIIIGMSKCGTTTMFQSLKETGITIKWHSDYTLERVYKTKELNTKDLLKLIEQPYKLFVPYREPISRKLSQFNQYKFGGTARDFVLGDYSTFSDGYRTEVDEDILYELIYDATGVHVLDYNFDKGLGHTTIVRNNMTLIPYTLEMIDILAKRLKLTLLNGRITGWGKQNLKFSSAELDKIYSSKYCQHFYTTKQIDIFKEARK